MAQHRTTGEIGVPCPRCKRPTQVREHAQLRAKHFTQPYYFSKWFFCSNRDCKVSIHMVEEFKVYNDNKAARQFKDLKEDAENQARIFNL